MSAFQLSKMSSTWFLSKEYWTRWTRVLFNKLTSKQNFHISRHKKVRPHLGSPKRGKDPSYYIKFFCICSLKDGAWDSQLLVWGVNTRGSWGYYYIYFIFLYLQPEGRSLGFSVVGLRSEHQGELGIYVQEIQIEGIAGTHFHFPLFGRIKNNIKTMNGF